MRTALFTVSFAGFWGQHRLTLEEAIDKTAELGFEGIEIMGKRPHLSPLDYDIEDCLRLRERLEARGLKVAAVAAYTNFNGGLDSPEVPFVEMQVHQVAELARRAAALGGNLVRIFTSYERPEVPLMRQWDLTVEAIRDCCDRAAEFDVQIGVQNHHDLGVDTKTLAALLAEVDRPNLTPLYDCWSVHLRGQKIADDIQHLSSAIAAMPMTTVADYQVLPRWQYHPREVNYAPLSPPLARAVPMGTGDLDYSAFFSALAQGGFSGWVSYEMCSPVRGGGALSNLEACARAFLQYMRR
jgi:sugar phosphate isomerase/epimerase